MAQIPRGLYAWISFSETDYLPMTLIGGYNPPAFSAQMAARWTLR